MTPTALPPPSPTPTNQQTLVVTATTVRPSVVKIQTLLNVGSGVIIETSADGEALVLTAYQVVEDGTAIAVLVNDAALHTGEIAGVDEVRNLALVRICCSEDFQTAPLGSVIAPPAGDTVFAMGYSLGGNRAVVAETEVAGIEFDSSTLRWLVRTRSPVDPDQLGGPLFTLDGRITGVNISEPGSPASSGFAVSAATVLEDLPFLRMGRTAPLPSSPSPTATPIPIPQPLTQSVTEFGLGDLIRLGDLVAVVLGWREPDLPVHIRPNPGKRYVAVDLALVNAGERDVSRLFYIRLKDSATRVYDPDRRWGEFARGAPLPGEGVISPGERIRSEVVFEAESDAEEMVLSFTLRTFSAQEALIALGPSPRAIEPPALIPGETPPTVFATGEPVEAGDVELLLHGARSLTEGLPVRPDAGRRFVVLDLAVRNLSTAITEVDSEKQLTLKDSQGYSYTIHPATWSAIRSPVNGSFDGGQVKRGPIVFEIPHDAGGLTLVFEPLFGFGKVVIAVDPD